MTIVVTGAAGFLGSHLVEKLSARGERVVGIDRRPGVPTCAREPIRADLSVRSEVADAWSLFAGADAVFHLAGCPGVRWSDPDTELRRYRDNVRAGSFVLGAVPPAVPVVVVSSSSVYGGALHDGLLRASRESDPLRPRGGYARSKALLEAHCRARAERGGLVAIVRPFTVAGERQREDMAIACWLREVRAGRPIRILGSPERTRDVADVRDVVEGLVRVAERGVTGAVNLGTGTGHRLADMAAAVCQALAQPAEVVVAPAGGADVPATLADTSRCQRLLGLRPQADLLALVRRQAGAAEREPVRRLRPVAVVG